MKTAAVYVRCSTASQVGTSSLPRQLVCCKMWCAKNNIKIVEIIADVGSGYDGYHLDYSKFKSSRKGNLGKTLNKYESDPSTRPDYFIYEDMDRLCRNWDMYFSLVDRISNLGIEPESMGVQPVDWGIELSTAERISIYDIKPS